MKSILALCCSFLGILSPAVAQACAICTNHPDLGSGVDDACTKVLVSFQRHDNGDCKNNPTCLPSKVCLFSLTVTFTYKQCNGVSYCERFCTSPAGANGAPIPGTEACGACVAYPNPFVITDHAVACGRYDCLSFERTNADGTVTVVCKPGAGCSTCVN